MAWAVPATYTTGQVLTASNLNTYLRDNMKAVGGADKAACRVYNTALQNVLNSTITAITFDSERFNAQAMHSTVTNTSRITIPAAWGGQYLIGTAILWAGNATGVRQTAIRLNGSVDLALSVGPNSAAAQNDGVQVVTFYQFSAGDYVECAVWQNSTITLATNVTGVKSPEFWAMWTGTG